MEQLRPLGVGLPLLLELKELGLGPDVASKNRRLPVVASHAAPLRHAHAQTTVSLVARCRGGDGAEAGVGVLERRQRRAAAPGNIAGRGVAFGQSQGADGRRARRAGLTCCEICGAIVVRRPKDGGAIPPLNNEEDEAAQQFDPFSCSKSYNLVPFGSTNWNSSWDAIRRRFRATAGGRQVRREGGSACAAAGAPPAPVCPR